MWKHFPKVDQVVQRSPAWLGLFAAITGVVAWAVKNQNAFTHVNWPLAILIGLAATWLLILVTSLGLVAWRYSRTASPVALLHDPRAISTPELAGALRGEIASLEKRFLSQVREVGTTSERLKNELETTFRNAEDSRLSQISRIKNNIDKVTDRLKADDLDLKHLLYFSVLQSSLAVLEYLADSAPSGHLHLQNEPDPAVREEKFEAKIKYVSMALNALSGTHRGSIAQTVVQAAENEAEEKIRKLPKSERPSDIDVLDLRRFEIASTRAHRLRNFLVQERQQLAGDIRSQRHNLIQQRDLRSPP